MSLSDISDLTELSSEEDFPVVKKPQKPKRQTKEYKISNVLRAPRTTQYTAKSLYDQIIDNSIDLDPEYQRDVVWSDEKQSGLIDSILRNYYMPPIIFAVSFQEDGSELRTCIDGKQRLTSIQKFIDGQIPHKDSFTNEKLWYKSSASNPKRKVLPQHFKTLFSNKQVVCVEYSDLSDEQEREIFQRVQLGVALTPAERLQAIVGPWSTVIRDIQSQILGDEGFEGYLDWGHARGRDFQCLASIGYLIESLPKLSVPSAKVLEKWLHRRDPVKPSLISDLQDTFRIFVILARDKQYSGSLNRPTRVSPIEFVMIGVLIHLKRTSLSLTQLSSAIEKMRKDVRASEKDIRANTRVTKLMMDFMNKRLKVSELKKDGEGDLPASIAAKKEKSSKRKRPVDSSDEESEEEPPLRKVTAVEPSTTTGPSKSGPKSAKQAPRNRSSPLASSGGRLTAIKTSPSGPADQPTTSQKSAAPGSQQPTISASSSGDMQSTPRPTTLTAPQASAPSSSQFSAPNPATASQQSPALVAIAPSVPSSATQSPILPIPVPRVEAESTVPPLSAVPHHIQSPVPSPITPVSLTDRLAPIRAAKAAVRGSDGGTQPDQSSRPGTPVQISSSFGRPHLLTNGPSTSGMGTSGNLSPPQRHGPPQNPRPTQQPLPTQPPFPPQPALPPQHMQHGADVYPPPSQHPSLPRPSVAPRQPSPQIPQGPRSVHQSYMPPQPHRASFAGHTGGHPLPQRPPSATPNSSTYQHKPSGPQGGTVPPHGSQTHTLPSRPPPAAPSAHAHAYATHRSYAQEKRPSTDDRRSVPNDQGSGRGWEKEKEWEREIETDRYDARRDPAWGREWDWNSAPSYTRGGWRPGRGRGRGG